MKPVRCFLFLLVSVVLLALSAEAAPFKPSEPFLRTSSLRPGMKGYALTVISGREILRFPVEIVSIIPRKGSPKNLIMVRASGSVISQTGGIAAGMSGSPVYVNGKLIGAVGYGWNFSDHNLGLVTPFEDMASVWDWPEKKFPCQVFLPRDPSLMMKTAREKKRLRPGMGLRRKTAA
jgi:Glycine/serine hydroxymethyltransferase